MTFAVRTKLLKAFFEDAEFNAKYESSPQNFYELLLEFCRKKGYMSFL
jgi:hypothetical protein